MKFKENLYVNVNHLVLLIPTGIIKKDINNIVNFYFYVLLIKILSPFSIW